MSAQAQPEPSWDCPHCNWPPSYHPRDIEHRYCGHCHHYCDDHPTPAPVYGVLKMWKRTGGKGHLVTHDLDEVLADVRSALLGGVSEVRIRRGLDHDPPKPSKTG